MNMSFWSHCQGLVRRLQKRRLARPRARQRGWGLAETLEARALLSSTPAMVGDINPGPASSMSTTYWWPPAIAAIGSTIYFTADDGIHGAELWKSDGTIGGTMMVKDIVPGAGEPNLANFTNVNGTLFFTANDGIHGNELWKSDGTDAGTVMVRDINPGRPSPGHQSLDDPSGLTNVNGTLFFSADDGVHGSELWKSDGTAAGTTMVKDIAPGGFIGYYGGYYVRSSNPGSLINVNGTLFFGASSINGGPPDLWKSDGTAEGTIRLLWTVVGGEPTNVNGTLFFRAADSSSGAELWKSDGTVGGTTLVRLLGLEL